MDNPLALSNVDQECLLLLIGTLNEGERNWKDLASLYNHTPAEIDSLDHDGARASRLIQQLVSSGTTVPNLIQRLHEIERTDAAELLMKFVASKQQGMRNGNLSSGKSNKLPTVEPLFIYLLFISSALLLLSRFRLSYT